jgi:alpha-mannosidase
MYPDPKYWMARSLESPTIYSFVMNNHWGVNYCADQQGLVEFRYSICPHGVYCPLEAMRFGTGRSQPLLASVGEPSSSGPRLAISPAEVIATALRPSRDGKALIVRLFGAGGSDEKAALRWARPAPKTVWLSDLSERPIAAAGETIEVPARGVVTLRAEMQ